VLLVALSLASLRRKKKRAANRD